MIKRILGICTIAFIVGGCNGDRYNVTCSDGTVFNNVIIGTIDGYMYVSNSFNGSTIAKLSMSLGCKAILIEKP